MRNIILQGLRLLSIGGYALKCNSNITEGVLTRLVCGVSVKKKNVMTNKIAGFGHLNFFS